MVSQKQFQTLVDSIDSLGQKELEELLKGFPFPMMLNTSILDFEEIRLSLNFLKKLSKRDLFYNYPEIVKCCWEFALMNLSSLENLPVDDILFNLLELVQHVISKMKTLHEFVPHLWKERERVLDILSFATKLKIFSESHVPNCTSILSELIPINEPLPPTASKNLADIAGVYKELRVVHEMVVLCDISFKKFTFSTEIYNVCATWLLENGANLLIENDEDETLSLLLKVVVDLYTDCSYFTNSDTEKFRCSLKKVSHRLILLSNKPNLRDESLKLLAILISEYKSKEMGVKEPYTAILSKILQLPVDITQWPYVQPDTFFYVCSYLCTHSSLPWKSSEVIDSISTFVYSYNRFTISWNLLKSLCHIYSAVMDDSPSKSTLLLGDELLIILSRFPYSFSKIITYRAPQLTWMLKRGCRYVKKRVLVEWLKRDQDLETLGKAIVQCRAGNVLLDIIADENLEELTKKATEMCHKIQYKELSENIAWMIPKAFHNKKLLDKLILSNPGIPESQEMALKLCQFMSLIMCFIDDEIVLKAACVYSKYLVTALKKENNVISVFCHDLRNIHFLAIKVKYVGEETAVEILRLLKVLILIQKRNHNVLENCVEADLSLSLNGSPSKTEKCLDLLQIVVTSKQVFIRIEKSSVLNIFKNLFNVSLDPKFSLRAFVCLTSILKANEWLVHFHSTSVFVEVRCSLAVDEKSAPEFLMFLTVWMKILANTSCTNIFYLPDKRIISNYIKRVEFLSQRKETYLLHLLNKITLFNGRSVTNGSDIE